MSSYPNMSYCMCENTLAALNQVLNAMREEGPMFLQDLSQSERMNYKALFNTCEDFLSASEELQDEYEREYDGQPDEAKEWADYDPDC